MTLHIKEDNLRYFKIFYQNPYISKIRQNTYELHPLEINQAIRAEYLNLLRYLLLEVKTPAPNKLEFSLYLNSIRSLIDLLPEEQKRFEHQHLSDFLRVWLSTLPKNLQPLKRKQLKSHLEYQEDYSM